MKYKIISINYIAAILMFAITLFSSCGDETDFSPYVESIPAANASVKFQHVAVPTGANFTVNWFLNNVKTSSVLVIDDLPKGISYGGSYPVAINYATVPAGSLNMKVEIPATSTVEASTLFTSTLALEGGKNYTTFVVGASPDYSAYTVLDDLTVGDPTKTYVRFLNVISNSPIAGYDLSINQLSSNAVIYSGVAYLGGNNTFIPITPIPDLESTTYEVQLREVGTTTIVAKFTFTPRKGRVYTFYSYGLVGGPTANVPKLTYYTNK